MNFTSPTFLYVFLPAFLLVYFVCSGTRAKNYCLLAASLLFYAWGEIAQVHWLLGSALVSWIGGLAMARPAQRRLALLLGVGAHVALLSAFKLFFPASSLPLGLSFFVFHAISYLVDVYRGTVDPVRRFSDLLLYFSFFPQLIAGPIVRFKDISAQIYSRSVSLDDLHAGCTRFVTGLAQKVLVADRLGVVADYAFQLPPSQLGSSLAWLGMISYTLQIYFDFSGYSSMAIGIARLLGFRFPENFDFPYSSTSMTEFWRRWHISLSTWFRDYLYIPLGGNRGTPVRTALNLLVVFLLCGLWHGASWNFVAWGLYHGAFLGFERLSQRPSRPSLFARAYTLTVVAVGFVIFRTASLDRAAAFVGSLFARAKVPGAMPVEALLTTESLLALAAAVIFSVRWPARAPGWQGAMRIAEPFAAGALYWLAVSYTATSHYHPFIYFRF